jgi:hypothetical protein
MTTKERQAAEELVRLLTKRQDSPFRNLRQSNVDLYAIHEITKMAGYVAAA